MKNILILTSTYLPNPGANGIITDILVQELRKKNFNLYVLCVKSNEEELSQEEINGVKIFRISKSKFSRKYDLLMKEDSLLNSLKLNFLICQRRLLNIVRIKHFPAFDREQIDVISKLVLSIIEEKHINTIIGVNKPFSNIASLIDMSKKYPKKKFIALFLDTIESIMKPKLLPIKIYNELINKTYVELLNSDIISYMPINIEDTLIKKGISKNFSFFEFPTIKIENYQKETQNSNDTRINFIYAGSLEKNVRNPDLFFEAASALNERAISNSVKLYGKIDKFTREKVDKYKKIEHFGVINQHEINKEYQNADFLINVSNTRTESVPSKMFELFSTGRPIINFVENENDFSIPYFEKYPIHFNFYLTKSFEEQMEKLENFIVKNRGKQVPKDEILNIYYKHTPQYFAEQIVKEI